MKYIALFDGKKCEEGDLKLDYRNDLPNSIMCKTGLYMFKEVFMDCKTGRLTVLYVMNSKSKP